MLKNAQESCQFERISSLICKLFILYNRNLEIDVISWRIVLLPSVLFRWFYMAKMNSFSSRTSLRFHHLDSFFFVRSFLVLKDIQWILLDRLEKFSKSIALSVARICKALDVFHSLSLDKKTQWVKKQKNSIDPKAYEREKERKRRKKTSITLFSVVLLISLLSKTCTDGESTLDGSKKEREEKKKWTNQMRVRLSDRIVQGK